MFAVLPYAELLSCIDNIDPVAYARTRNYQTGSVTRLSPYISRGVVSTRFIFDRLRAAGHTWKEMEKLVQELAWRDYFQRVWQVRGPSLVEELKHPQQHIVHGEIPVAVVNAVTGIQAIDEGIFGLYREGYMHNHMRMYVASVCCNIGRAHWLQPARWMYYHLLDADWGSNACSWQWVCGAFSNKRYFANQENINRFFGTAQQHTFLDLPYEAMEHIPVPDVLSRSTPFMVDALLPASDEIASAHSEKVLLYNWYNLDPFWHKDEPCTRILLLEPEIFGRYPIAPHSVAFMLQLARAIPGLRVFTGSFAELKQYFPHARFYYKEHPWNHYDGCEEPRDWLAPGVNGWYPGFFPYWTKVSAVLQKELNV
ncbi:FAD-binding domain-containing protein [Rurimicrobium arvi]|uniref:Cryptochrome/DNA photolyase FAD-binding domain-containing protein n=1 Tax=Rurimicrobium arvi TaxID=2049916 RepID=A0ABP8MXI6_9BACT